MKKNFTIIITALIFSVALKANAQTQFAGLVKSGPGNANKLSKAYVGPLFKGFGAGMNSGWVTTADAKKPLAFDLTVSSAIAFTPSSDKTFDVTKLGLSNSIRLEPGSPAITPTIAGNKNNLAIIEVYDKNNNKIDEVTIPARKLAVVPMPTIQLTTGIFINTDITGRYLPKINVGNDFGTVTMFGFGVKHNVIKDFKMANGNPYPFDLAIAFAYSRLNFNVPLNVQPNSNALPAPENQTTDFTNQNAKGHLNSVVAQAIISKKYKFFNPFLAVGYQNTRTTVGSTGYYPYNAYATNGQNFYRIYTNPIDIYESSTNGLRADIGFQLKFGLFRFYASYGAAIYQSVNAGVGLGI